MGFSATGGTGSSSPAWTGASVLAFLGFFVVRVWWPARLFRGAEFVSKAFPNRTWRRVWTGIRAQIAVGGGLERVDE